MTDQNAFTEQSLALARFANHCHHIREAGIYGDNYEVRHAVSDARIDGASWEVIGLALGVSPQTARAQFD